MERVIHTSGEWSEHTMLAGRTHHGRIEWNQRGVDSCFPGERNRKCRQSRVKETGKNVATEVRPLEEKRSLLRPWGDPIPRDLDRCRPTGHGPPEWVGSFPADETSRMSSVWSWTPSDTTNGTVSGLHLRKDPCDKITFTSQRKDSLFVCITQRMSRV